MSEVRYGLLGPFEIRADDEQVVITGAAERALLAILLLSAGRPVPATTLIDRLWAEGALPVDPMNALQLRVSKLRRTLKERGLPTVRRNGVGYQLDVDPALVDTERFGALVRATRTHRGDPDGRLRSLDEALSLWRGQALADFVTEPWATAEAARLDEVRRGAVAERAHLAIGAGRSLEVISDLEPLVAADPTQEALAGLLMLALYRAGRQAEALDVYARTRQLLHDDLGLEPSTTLRSLHERVLRQDESLGASAELVTPSPVPPVERAEPVGAAGLPSDVPALLSPPIGRDAELESVTGLLAGSRLVTLVGPGGAGKTTLGLAVAAAAAGRFPDGAAVVRLASSRDGASVPTVLADALGVPLDGTAGADDVLSEVLRYLAGRRALIVVDNCEHVIDAAATTVEELLARCPGVTVLATSREALAIPAEVQVLVGPLPTPPENALPDEVAEFPAAQLFLRRVKAVRPGRDFDSDDLLSLGRVCRALDGLPLALELAAARVATLSISEIADRLDQRFTLLTAGSRTAEARQRTLRSTVDWSHDLLSENERLVFARLSVFHGGWTLESAEAVAAGADVEGGDVLFALSRLVEQSLVVAAPGRTTRYSMLETLREYAAERLEAAGARIEFERRHAEHFRDVAISTAAALRGANQPEALRRLREDYSNIRAALMWCAGRHGHVDDALRVAGALGLFWHLGRQVEGRDLLRRLLDQPGGSATARAQALQGQSIVQRPRGCIVHPDDACGRAARESLSIFEASGLRSEAALSRVLMAVESVNDPDVEIEALVASPLQHFADTGDTWGLGVIGFLRMESALKQGREDDARRIGGDAAAAFRQLDDRWGLSAVQYHLGCGLRQFGAYDEAARMLEEAIDVAASVGLDNHVQWALADLGITQLYLGHVEIADGYFARSRDVSARVGDGAGAVLSDYGTGMSRLMTGRWEEALELLDSAVDGFEQLGTPTMRGQALLGRGRCLEELGAAERARAAYAEAAETGQRSGEPGVTAGAWEGLARCARLAGDPDRARELSTAAGQLRVERRRPAPPHERPAWQPQPQPQPRTPPAPIDSRRTAAGQQRPTGSLP